MTACTGVALPAASPGTSPTQTKTKRTPTTERKGLAFTARDNTDALWMSNHASADVKGEHVAIEESKEPVAEAQMANAARRLLDASALCAIATVRDDGSAYVNTAYFAFSPVFDLVWMSEPQAQHSRNIRERRTAAVAVYDSTQRWGRQDRGIQLVGSALEARQSDELEAVYAGRFPEFDPEDFGDYRFYLFRPERIKLFDEQEFGSGVFVTARVEGGGGLVWETTDLYRSEVDM